MRRNIKKTFFILMAFVFGSSSLPEIARAGWFWNRGELKCETRLNGKNCWWEDSNSASDQYDQIKTPYYDMYSKALRGTGTDNQDLQLLNHKIMKLVEESANLLTQMKEDDHRRDVLAQNLVTRIQILQASAQLYSMTVQSPSNYWSSRGPRYIEAIRKDEKKVKCLLSHLNSAVNSDAINELISKTEFGFVNCGFIEGAR